MDSSAELVYGKRLPNRSIKIYKQTNSKYLIQLKYYFLGFCYKKRDNIAENYSEVEDYIIDFKDHPTKIR